MTAVYKTGQITLANGSAVVIGVGTAWATMLIAGGIIFPVVGGNPLAIKTVDSNTSITAEKPWAGVSGTYDYVLVRWSADEEQNSINSSILATVYAELQAGTIWKYDIAGPAADRATYNERPKGFSYLVIDSNPAQLFIKASATSGDWAGPFAYASGPEGPTGPAGYVNYRGAYSAVTAYAKNDGVLSGGSTYVALQATTGNAPPTYPTTSTAYWQLTALKGTDGTGTGDVVGPAGATDDMPAFFDGTTGKLLKFKTKAQFKTWLAATALDVSFDNSVANLAGNPTTVQAAINAVGNSGGRNDALLALEMADLKGQRIAISGGVADAFDDETGVNTGGSVNQSYDATNDWYKPTSSGGTDQIPTMTAATTSGVTMSGNTDQGAGYEAWRAGNKITGESGSGFYWQSNAALPQDLTIDLGSGNPKTITSYRLKLSAAPTVQITAFNLQGSNDNSVWTTIDTRSGLSWASGEYKTFTVTSPASYRYYRLNTTARTSAIALDEINLYTALILSNMTLVSVAYTAAASPSLSKIAVQTVETDAITVNTDITAEISRDGGTTWTLAPLALSTNLNSVKVYEGQASLSAQPSGTSMRWRIKTLNNKNLAVSGVVLQYS